MIWVFIDLSWLVYRAFHSVGDLEHDDLPTGVCFGFFHQLRQICTDPRIQSNRVAVFADSCHSFRAQAFKEYKAKRQEKKEEDLVRMRIVLQQKDELRKRLPTLGIPVYHQVGLESDDLMASAARRLAEASKGTPGRRAVMITSDGDLFQCITPEIHWWDAQRNIYFTPESFLEEKGIEAERWGEVKCLAGCTTDNVPGVGGVGEGTAIKYLLGDLPPRYKTYETIMSPAGKVKALRNRSLVCLPHERTKPFDLREPAYKPEAFFAMCKEKGFESFLQERKIWERFFRGREFRHRKRGERR